MCLLILYFGTIFDVITQKTCHAVQEAMKDFYFNNSNIRIKVQMMNVCILKYSVCMLTNMLCNQHS